jgi:excisionase family DNA binding protein
MKGSPVRVRPSASLPSHKAPASAGLLPVPAEFLTIAEAAQRVRCCERTIRRAIDSGALRAGRIHAVDGKRGGFRIRPADLETWMYGDGR